jgi:PPOX class probable F420-dependent enzyme
MLPVQTPTNVESLRPPVAGSPRTPVDQIRGQFLSLTSYKRDTTPVATPVWFADEGGRLLVMTEAHSGKVKRIRHDPYVEVAPCTARGTVRSAPTPAHAVVLPASETEWGTRLIARKYWVALLFVRPIRALQRLFHPDRRHEETVILAITPVSTS